MACLAAFGSWLGGNGMEARAALDQVPEQDYSMAGLIRTALDHGVNPTSWLPPPERAVPDESRTITPAHHHAHREPPTLGGGRDGHTPRI